MSGTLIYDNDFPSLVVDNLTASQAVVTDSGKKLASLAYGSAAAASSLLELDASSRAATKGIISSGTAPTINGTPTGIGSTGTVTFDTGSNDLSGQLIINPGGSGILTYCIIVLQFSAALPGNHFTLLLQLLSGANGNWGAGAITDLSNAKYAWVSQQFAQIIAINVNGGGAGGLTQGVTLPSGADQLRIGYQVILKMTPEKEERLFVELGSIMSGVRDIRKDQQAHEQLDALRFEHLEKDIATIKGDVAETGKHDLTKTEQELERMRQAETKLSDARWSKVFHVALIVFGALVSFAGTALARWGGK